MVKKFALGRIIEVCAWMWVCVRAHSFNFAKSSTSSKTKLRYIRVPTNRLSFFVSTHSYAHIKPKPVSNAEIQILNIIHILVVVRFTVTFSVSRLPGISRKVVDVF